MRKLQKIVICAALAVAIGTALLQTKRVASARAEVQSLRAEQASLFEQISNLKTALASMTNQLAGLSTTNPTLENNSDETELLKLRSEVTRLRPLQDDVVALQKMLKQSSAGLAAWKPNEITDAGHANPIDALQTYIFSSQNFDPAKIRDSIVGNATDPPEPDGLENFAKSKHHPGAIGAEGYKIISQTWIAQDKVQLELETFVHGGGLAVPITLQNINGEWKVVVFNIRDKNGNLEGVGFIHESASP